MSELPLNASIDEIEDEISLQHAFLESLGDDVGEDDERRLKIVACLDDLEARLESPKSHNSERDSIDDSGATSATSTSEVAGMSSLKRPGSFLEEGPSSKRPSRSHSVSSLESISSQTFRASQSTTATKERAWERQRLVEEAARKRNERERSDARYAAQLSQQANSPAGPSQSASTSRNHANTPPVARIFTPMSSQIVKPEFQASQRPSGVPQFGSSTPLGHYTSTGTPSYQRQLIKPEPYAQTSRPSLPTRPSLGGGMAEIVDLTADSSDETSPAIQANPYAFNTGPNYGAAQAYHQQQLQQQQRNQAAHVYGHTAPPPPIYSAGSDSEQRRIDDVRDQELRARAERRRREQQAGERVRQMNQLTTLSNQRNTKAGNDAWNALYRSVGSVANSMGQDLSQLGRLITGQSGPSAYDVDDDDDDVSFVRSQLLFDGVSDPQEVLEDLRNLMDNIKPDDELAVGETDVEVPGDRKSVV